MNNSNRGFTLIELMIAVSIIAILAAVALPAYNNYRIRSAETACLAETKNYANFAVVAIYNDSLPVAAELGACASIDTATDLNTDITGTPHSPGTRVTGCEMITGSCSLR